MTASGNLTAAAIIETLGLRRHPEGGWYAETFRDVEGGHAVIRRRSTICSNAAIARIGIASGMPSRSGTTTPARRSNSRSPSPAGRHRATGSVPISALAKGPSASFLRTGGNRRPRSATGRSSAAPSRPASSSPPSRWPRPTGGRRRIDLYSAGCGTALRKIMSRAASAAPPVTSRQAPAIRQDGSAKPNRIRINVDSTGAA